jgi:stearoyl-CoA desaturase (delta-9 desaturase)
MVISGSPAKTDTVFPPRVKKLNWMTVTVMVIFHIGAVAALFNFSWRNLIVAAVLLWFTVGLGISMGYHRLHTHRGYKCPLWLEYFFGLCGAMSLEGGPIFWVGTHRIHHQRSDLPGDPHSPKEGAFWAHMGWILNGEGNHNKTEKMAQFAPDLAKHRFYMVLNSWHWVPTVVLGLILWVTGGFSMVLWGIFLRIVVGMHFTWFVNSATHMWGSRRFETTDTSRNLWWVALLTFGEGWHNNHHAHPASIRHGLAWYEIDHSWILVNILKFLGLAWDLKVATLDSQVAVQRRAA